MQGPGLEAFVSTHGAAQAHSEKRCQWHEALRELAEMQGPGLELSRPQLQYHHKRMVQRDSNGMKP